MRLTCGHDDEEGFVCGRCVSEALKALDEARRDLIAWSTPTVVPLEEDCTRCASNAAEAARLAEGYLEALDRLGEVRFLARMWEGSVSTAAAFCGACLNQVLDAEHSVLRARKREREERDAAFRAGVCREMGWRHTPTTIGGRDGQ